MNIENIKELPSIVEAYKDGKIIQANYGNNQTMIDLPMLNMSDITNFIKGKCKLQIKPESEYVPFTFEDAEQLIGKGIKPKDESNKVVELILILDSDEIGLFSGRTITYKMLFENFTFLDDSPCGKIKE